MNRLLVDTCIWYALLDPSDDKHGYSRIIEEILEIHNIIIPYPVLYETLNTHFVKNRYLQCHKFFEYINNPSKVTLISDTPYREKALKIINENSNYQQQYSLVDMIIRLMMDDVGLGQKTVLSFNKDDFYGVNNTEVFSPSDMKTQKR